MLQLRELNRRARATISLDPDVHRDGDALERAADEAVARLRAQRLALSASTGERVLARLERWVDTDTVEYLDRDEHPESRKITQIRWLHRQNLALRSYHRFLRLLTPYVEEAARERNGAPARLLELGSGSGELALALARLASERRLPVEVTGSDIVPGYVRDANERAHTRGIAARFRELNAFALDGRVAPGEVDVAFVVQTIHHFSPGQLAKMIAQVGAIGARRFVGIDGRRNLALCAGLPILCSISLDPWFVHDAFVSTRRLYSEAELELVATLAAPGARVRVSSDGPFVSVLEVAFERRAAR